MMHPSGMTQERWGWPFKTPEERKLVIKYFRGLGKIDIDSFEEALL